jgi:hypothetical protein
VGFWILLLMRYPSRFNSILVGAPRRELDEDASIKNTPLGLTDSKSQGCGDVIVYGFHHETLWCCWCLSTKSLQLCLHSRQMELGPSLQVSCAETDMNALREVVQTNRLHQPVCWGRLAVLI